MSSILFHWGGHRTKDPRTERVCARRWRTWTGLYVKEMTRKTRLARRGESVTDKGGDDIKPKVWLKNKSSGGRGFSEWKERGTYCGVSTLGWDRRGCGLSWVTWGPNRSRGPTGFSHFSLFLFGSGPWLGNRPEWCWSHVSPRFTGDWLDVVIMV